EAALDDRLVGTGPYQDGVAPPSHEELDGLDDERLAGAGLARQGCHALVQYQREVGDHTEVADAELGQHQVSNPNLVLTMRWKSRGWKETRRASWGPALHTIVSPYSRVATAWPSTTRSAGRPSIRSRRRTSVPPS